jgi:hypothetical protein
MKHNQQGSILIKLLMLGVVAGGMYVMKDEKGESYLEKTYGAVKYYFVDRNEDAINQAKEVQGTMQRQQDAIQEALDETP